MKKILYLDLDGVMCNFNSAVLKINPEIKTLSKNAPNYEERFKMVEQVLLDNPRIFRDLEPIEGAIESVKKLWKHYDIYFLSTPCWVVPESYTDKRLWVGEHIGDMATNRLILTQRKDLNIGDYLVDDTYNNGAGDFTGKHIHFSPDGVFRSWKEVESFLINESLKEKLLKINV